MVKVCLSQIWQEEEPTSSLSTPSHRQKGLGYRISRLGCWSEPEDGAWCFQKCWGLSRWLSRTELVSIQESLRKLKRLKLCLWEGSASSRCVGRDIRCLVPAWQWSQGVLNGFVSHHSSRTSDPVAATLSAFQTHESNKWFINLPLQN